MHPLHLLLCSGSNGGDNVLLPMLFMHPMHLLFVVMRSVAEKREKVNLRSFAPILSDRESSLTLTL